MEDNRRESSLRLRRCFECGRLEEQLWSMAYEEIWPVLRRSLKPSAEARRTRQESIEPEKVARRA
jgi:hypothetical protein